MIKFLLQGLARRDVKMLQIEQKTKAVNIQIVLFISFMIYKLVLELGFWYVLQPVYAKENVYPFEFNLLHYLVGLFWTIFLFFLIRHDVHKPSTFFLELHYVIAIIPITVIFAFGNENMLFYNLLCIAFGIASIIIILGKNIKIPQISVSTPILIIGFYLITAIVYADIVLKNGMFTFKALDIYQVYSLRGQFILHKYIGYMFPWQYIVINPFFIIRFLERKKYGGAGVFIMLQFVTYLYSAQKTILFIIPLTLAVYVISKFRKLNVYIYSLFAGGTLFITVGSFFSETIYALYDLLIRRVLLLPANLKFIYYDFFSVNEKIGLAGTLWGKFLGAKYPYDRGIGYIISQTYFNDSVMNSNTGFIAEGYSRFSYIGVIIVFIVFALLLLLINYLGEQNGYSFALCMSLFSIFLLNDGEIIDPLIFGNLLILVFICLFYNKSDDFKIIKKGKKFSKG